MYSDHFRTFSYQVWRCFCEQYPKTLGNLMKIPQNSLHFTQKQDDRYSLVPLSSTLLKNHHEMPNLKALEPVTQ